MYDCAHCLSFYSTMLVGPDVVLLLQLLVFEYFLGLVMERVLDRSFHADLYLAKCKGERYGLVQSVWKAIRCARDDHVIIMNHLYALEFVPNVDFSSVLQVSFYHWASYPNVPEWAQRARLLTFNKVILHGDEDPVWYLGEWMMSNLTSRYY